MRLVLDTSVLIETAGAITLPADTSAAISVASLSELHFGVLEAEDPSERARRLQRLSMIESGFNPLPITARVARLHGELCAAVVRMGRQPRRRTMGLLIAATAADVGAALATLNVRDFAGLEEFVEVTDWRSLAG